MSAVYMLDHFISLLKLMQNMECKASVTELSKQACLWVAFAWFYILYRCFGSPMPSSFSKKESR